MSRMSGRSAWALVSLSGIAISCLGAILLPYFDIMAAIMGALGNLVAAYALPALFVLVGNLKHPASTHLRGRGLFADCHVLQHADVGAVVQGNRPGSRLRHLHSRGRPCVVYEIVSDTALAISATPYNEQGVYLSENSLEYVLCKLALAHVIGAKPHLVRS